MTGDLQYRFYLFIYLFIFISVCGRARGGYYKVCVCGGGGGGGEDTQDSTNMSAINIRCNLIFLRTFRSDSFRNAHTNI